MRLFNECRKLGNLGMREKNKDTAHEKCKPQTDVVVGIMVVLSMIASNAGSDKIEKKLDNVAKETQQLNQCLMDFSQCISGGNSDHAKKVRNLLASTTDASSLKGKELLFERKTRFSSEEDTLQIKKVFEASGFAGKTLCASYEFNLESPITNTACIPDPKIAALGSEPLQEPSGPALTN